MVEKIQTKAGNAYRELYKSHYIVEKELETIILRARKDYTTDIKITGHLDSLDICICFSSNVFDSKFNFPFDIIENLRREIPGFVELHLGNHPKYNHPLVMRFYGVAKKDWKYENTLELDLPNRIEQMFDFNKTLEYSPE